MATPQLLARQDSSSLATMAGRRVLAEGEVARESAVISGLVNLRHLALYGGEGPNEPPILASFRHRGDAHPSKCWALNRQCTLSGVTQGRYRLRDANTNTLYAYASGSYTEMTMVWAGRLGWGGADTLRYLCGLL